MTREDVKRLEEIRREVGLMRGDYSGEAYDRGLQAVLDGLDEALDGPYWRVAGSHKGTAGSAAVVVRAHSSTQAMARAEARLQRARLLEAGSVMASASSGCGATTATRGGCVTAPIRPCSSIRAWSS